MISVLLPVYNTSSTYLYECIESILKQTFQNFEIVIIDNGSQDIETIDVLDHYSYNDKVKTYICDRVTGKKNLSVALNYGLKKCQFEYVARMDSDDLMHPKRLEKQLQYMLDNPSVDILGTQLQHIGGDSSTATNHPEIIPQWYYKQKTHILNHPSVMFKRDRILDLGGYQEYPDHIPEDFILWVKALKANYTIRNLQEVLLFYRNRQDSLSMNDSKYESWYRAIFETINN